MTRQLKQQQLAALNQAEAALHVATLKCQKDPRNHAWRRERSQWEATVQDLRAQLFGRGRG